MRARTLRLGDGGRDERASASADASESSRARDDDDRRRLRPLRLRLRGDDKRRTRIHRDTTDIATSYHRLD